MFWNRSFGATVGSAGSCCHSGETSSVNKSMIGSVTLRKAELFDVAFNLNTGRQAIVGQSHAFYWDRFVEACKAQDENIDDLLSHLLLAGFAEKSPKRKVLIWYEPFQDLFRLTASSRGQRVPCHWIAEFPAHMEFGQAYLREHAQPYVYWDGLSLFRVYERPSKHKAGGHLVSDFGNLSGLSVASADEETYNRIRNQKRENPDYSPVANVPEEIVSVGGRKLALSHAFYELI